MSADFRGLFLDRTDSPSFLDSRDYISKQLDGLASQEKELDETLWHKQRNEVISWVMNAIIGVPNSIPGVKLPEFTPELVDSFQAVFTRIWDRIRQRFS